ncbi:hypothetical protein ACQKII_14980 [Lysinibacillus sp. NPDC048646]|uniref:hypothetical protein n=1 Tax=Lysinibacillus sp. NPDC048646 TaxID=3390574 RepID=UPI003D037213
MMISAFVFALAPVIVFPQHKSPKVTGKYEVATAIYTYIDNNRIEEFTDKGDNRFVNVAFWYPKRVDEKYPLLVFSHGAYGIKASNTSTYTACKPRLCSRFHRSSISLLLYCISGWNEGFN